MFEVVLRERLAENIVSLTIKAPLIVKKVKAGQFVILRLDERGERIPLTVVSSDSSNNTIRIIVQETGKTTMKFGKLRVGDAIRDIVGPLGNATEVKKYGHVLVVGGGVGLAEAYPVTQAFKKAKNKVSVIIGAQNKDLLILEDAFKQVCDVLYICTDDGSKGHKGFVTEVLNELLESGERIDLVYTVGPPVMMKKVAELTRPHAIHTIASLNTTMVDGTGMCGSCRVTVNGETKFACIDGPEFDAHKIDFTELLERQKLYQEKERISLQKYLREK